MNANLVNGGPDDWMYAAAIREASQLPLLRTGSGPLVRQLVLVRYTDQLQSAGFDHLKLAMHGPMWTDRITTLASETGRITGANRAALWVGLNVLRLGFPAGAQVPLRHASDDRGEVCWNHAEAGREFMLRRDIGTNEFSTIPLTYDISSRSYTQGPYQLSKFNGDHWLDPLTI